jgi:hypothetical protein
MIFCFNKQNKFYSKKYSHKAQGILWGANKYSTGSPSNLHYKVQTNITKNSTQLIRKTNSALNYLTQNTPQPCITTCIGWTRQTRIDLRQLLKSLKLPLLLNTKPDTTPDLRQQIPIIRTKVQNNWTDTHLVDQK